MNLEEKAKDEFNDHVEFCHQKRYGYRFGYRQCKTDLIEFLKVNHRASVKDILKHLEDLV